MWCVTYTGVPFRSDVRDNRDHSSDNVCWKDGIPDVTPQPPASTSASATLVGTTHTSVGANDPPALGSDDELLTTSVTGNEATATNNANNVRNGSDSAIDGKEEGDTDDGEQQFGGGLGDTGVTTHTNAGDKAGTLDANADELDGDADDVFPTESKGSTSSSSSSSSLTVGLVAALVTVVLVLLGVVGIVWFTRQTSGNAPAQVAHNNTHSRHQAVVDNAAFAKAGTSSTANIGASAGLDSDVVFTTATTSFSVPVEGDSAYSGAAALYMEPASEQPQLYEAAKQVRLSRHVYAEPDTRSLPSRANAPINSNDAYSSELQRTASPTAAEQHSGGYAHVVGGQLYSTSAASPPRESDRTSAVATGAAASTTRPHVHAPPGPHEYDVPFASATNLDNVIQHHDMPYGGLKPGTAHAAVRAQASSKDGARARVATDWSDHQLTSQPPSTNRDGNGSSRGGIARSGRKGSVYDGFGDGGAGSSA
jgi:hypothetical protein